MPMMESPILAPFTNIFLEKNGRNKLIGKMFLVFVFFTLKLPNYME
tara:strand:+ start:556 stop:693 length:138 start_codon:yes stop_codon:yes gene_type:complete